MRHESFRVYLELGLAPWLIPLEGKIPWSGWRGREHQPSEQLGMSAIEGPGNVGLALGVRSGFVVLDDDRAKHGIDPRGWVPPHTDMVVATAGGGKHYYYAIDPEADGVPASPPNKPHNVDFLSTGKLCVAAGNEGYAWENQGEPGVWPFYKAADVRAAGAGAALPPGPVGAEHEDGMALLAEACTKIAQARAGARNETMNAMAYAVGQAVGGGYLDAQRAWDALGAAAQENGCDDDDLRALANGFGTGRENPQPPSLSAMTGQPRAAGADFVWEPSKYFEGWPVACKGNGEVTESRPQSGADFARDAAAAHGSMYNSGGRVATVGDGSLIVWASENKQGQGPGGLAASLERRMGFLTSAVKRPSEGEGGKCRVVTTQLMPANKHGRMLMDYVRAMPPLRIFSRHPLLMPTDTWAQSGYDLAGGVYVSDVLGEVVPNDEGLDPLRDLIERYGFRFSGQADFHRYAALLLSALMRPRIAAPGPLFIFAGADGTAGQDRGKTTLATLASILLGGERPVGGPRQISGTAHDESELVKSLGHVISLRAPVILFDNIERRIGSATLAELVTAGQADFRVLGQGISARAELSSQLVITSNTDNLGTDFIRGRACPILLAPMGELRDGGGGSGDIYRDALGERARVLGGLMGLVEEWLARGSPRGQRPSWTRSRAWGEIMAGVLDGRALEDEGTEEWFEGVDADRAAASDVILDMVKRKGMANRWTGSEMLHGGPWGSPEAMCRALGEANTKNALMALRRVADATQAKPVDGWTIAKKKLHGVVTWTLTKGGGCNPPPQGSGEGPILPT